MSEFVTSADGTRIAFTRAGSGPVVIHVAGATAFRATDPEIAVLAAALKDRFTFISYDRRGRGESTDTAPYAKEREFDDLRALFAANGGRASLYGISSGAVLAIEAAAAGLPVDRVIAHEPPVREYPATYVSSLDAANAADDRDSAVEIFMRDAVGLPPDQIAGMKQSPYWPVLQSIAPTIAYDARFVVGAGDFATRWKTVTTPVLITNGTESFPIFPPICDALAKALPNGSRRTIPGGHGPAATVIAPVIREFLAA